MLPLFAQVPVTEVGLATRPEAAGPETVRLTVMVLSGTVTPDPRPVDCRLTVVLAVPDVDRLSHAEPACTVKVTGLPDVAVLLPASGAGYVNQLEAGLLLSKAKGVPPVAVDETVIVCAGPG